MYEYCYCIMNLFVTDLSLFQFERRWSYMEIDIFPEDCLSSSGIALFD